MEKEFLSCGYTVPLSGLIANAVLSSGEFHYQRMPVPEM
jgi:hypothetical protein